MILNMFKSELLDLNFQTRILEICSWDEIVAKDIVISIQETIDRYSEKDMEFITFDMVRESLLHELESTMDLPEDVVSAFDEYICKLVESNFLIEEKGYEA